MATYYCKERWKDPNGYPQGTSYTFDYGDYTSFRDLRMGKKMHEQGMKKFRPKRSRKPKPAPAK